MGPHELGICVVGCGALGTTHAEAWRDVEDVRLVAVADTDAARAEALARKLGVSRWSRYVPATPSIFAPRAEE